MQPYLVSWFRYDPAAEAAKLKVPLLVLQGTSDMQVNELDARLLANANRRATLVILNGMNHVFKDVSGGPSEQAQSYSDPTLPLDAGLVRAIVQFINTQPHR